MKKQQIEQWVSSVLQGIPVEKPDLSVDSAHEQFLLNCAKRLITTFMLYQQDEKFQGDSLVSLRNYLLTFQTEILIVMEGS